MITVLHLPDLKINPLSDDEDLILTVVDVIELGTKVANFTNKYTKDDVFKLTSGEKWVDYIISKDSNRATRIGDVLIEDGIPYVIGGFNFLRVSPKRISKLE